MVERSELQNMLSAVTQGGGVVRPLTRRGFALMGLAAGVGACLPDVAHAARHIAVSGVRLGGNTKSTRLVLDLAGKPKHRIFYLTNPYRIVFDFPEFDWSVPNSKMPTARGLIKSMRVGLFQPGVYRLVLDLNGPAEVSRILTLAPQSGFNWRFVVDLKPTSHEGFMAHLGRTEGVKLQQAKAVEPALSERTGRSQNAKPVIILDPGHGGVDPGAIGVNGVYEKHITLAMARQLKKELERTGRYKVVLTRTRDIFVSLRGRVRVARQAKGDLFISLHADSHRNRKTRGLSIYTLSERASDKEAALLAEKENKADIISGMDFSEESPEVTGILIDLAQRESMNLSSQFATLAVGQLRRQVKTLSNTHRFAGFAVLKAPDIPSVLLEMGYLSNRTEVRLLQKSSYRGKLAKAMVQSIDHYFDQTQSAQRP